MTVIHQASFLPPSAIRCGWSRRPCRTVAAVALGLALGVTAAAPPTRAAEKPAQPAQHASQQSPATTAPVRVDGFRSAHWGMTEAEVKEAIRHDFGIPPDKMHVEENPSERTKIITATVKDLLQGAGDARISYILGYRTKRLIQVNIVWGITVDPHVKPQLVVAAANQLRTLFLTSGYQPGTIASNVATGRGAMIVFEGRDAEKHMTFLRLISVSSRQHRHRKSAAPAVLLVLSYIENTTDPDIYRLKKGQF